MLDKNSFDVFENDFIFTPYFIVNYYEFVNKLIELGYDVKYQNFDKFDQMFLLNFLY